MLSLILPVYNEKENLSKNFNRIEEKLRAMGKRFEIIISEDGSDDGTRELARELSEKHDYVRLIHNKERLGKGLAIKRGARLSQGDTIGFIDIDLSADVSNIGLLLESLDSNDIAISSRAPKHEVNRKFKRLFLSNSYNLLIRSIFRSRINDHQCGLKLFRKNAFLDLIDLSRNNSWFFDSEVLILAQDLGYRIEEIPIKWNEGNQSKVNSIRIVLSMLSDIIRFYLHRRKYLHSPDKP